MFFLLLTAFGLGINAATCTLAQAQTTPANTNNLFLGDSTFTLARALELDKNIVTIGDETAVNLRAGVLVYSDPDGRLDARTIATRYLRGERPALPQNSDLLYPTRGEPLWLLIPIDNRTGKMSWLLDFGRPHEGRRAVFQALTVMNPASNQAFFNQSLVQSRSGFAPTLLTPRLSSAVDVLLPTQGRSLLLIRATTTPGVPALFPLTLRASDQDIATPWWLNTNLYWVLLFITSGMIAMLAFLTHRPGLLFFVLHLIGLAGVTLWPMPLLNHGGFWHLIPTYALILAGMGLSLGVMSLARMHGMRMAWTLVYSMILIIYAAFAVGASLLPSPMPNSFLFALVIALPAALLGTLIGTYLLKESDANGFIFFPLAGLWLGVAILASLATNGILPTALEFLNASLLASPVQGGLILLLLHRLNLFSEGAENTRRRHRSTNDEEQLAKLRYAKENFDYNNLLKVIEHERRQLADARTREQLRTDEMRKAKEQADEANRAKSAFLAVVSHEIRTPMTGIMGMVKLLLDTTLSKTQNEFVMTIKESGNAMMGLLNDILDFEKIESGKMQLEALDFDLHRLIAGVTTLMNGHATTKGITLTIELDASVPQYVVGDVTRLRQVLLNLIGNAIKFTKQGGVTVKLSASLNEQLGVGRSYQVYFAITDTGIGISSEQQKNIFNPFAQADKTIARKFGGSGLGLAISKRLIEAMGSQINIKSRENEGTTFFFSLNMKEGDKSVADEGTARASAKPSTGAPGNRQHARKLRVLVVEDNTITQRVLKTMIEQDRHTVLACASAEDALPYLNMGERFDVIFSDIQMNGMSGYDFTKEVRKLETAQGQHTPIYALTGNVDQSDIDAALAAGMDGHLGKPVDPDVLDEILETIARGDDGGGGKDRGRMPKTPKIAHDPELELIATLRESLGDDQVQELLKGLYNKAEEIITALTTPDSLPLETIRARAHELKGMCGNFGMMSLSDLAKKIEYAAKEGRGDEALGLIKNLPPTYQTGRQKIDDWMAS